MKRRGTKENESRTIDTMPADYAKGKLYSIRCYSHPELVYIGSTIQSLPKRLGGHRRDFKDGKINYSSFQLVQHPDHYIELIEEFPCNNKMELLRREGQIIRITECVNKVVPGRTDAEYREENKGNIAQKDKQYRANNKEKIAQKNKRYCEKNKEKIRQRKSERITCDCGLEIARGRKSTHIKTKKHRELYYDKLHAFIHA